MFAEDDVQKMLTNPIYAGGVGNYPPIIGEKKWVTSLARYISENGLSATLEQVEENLREAGLNVPVWTLKSRTARGQAKEILKACRDANQVQ